MWHDLLVCDGGDAAHRSAEDPSRDEARSPTPLPAGNGEEHVLQAGRDLLAERLLRAGGPRGVDERLGPRPRRRRTARAAPRRTARPRARREAPRAPPEGACARGARRCAPYERALEACRVSSATSSAVDHEPTRPQYSASSM